MKTGRNYLTGLSLGLMLCWSIPQNLIAQSENQGSLLSVTEFIIKPGHEMQFREGVKAWKTCYEKNNGDWTWKLWQRQAGEGSMYALATEMANWAELDENDESGKECQQLALSMINPHIEKGTKHISRLMPEFSRGTALTDELIMVTYYKQNAENGHHMMDVVKEMIEIRKKANFEPLGYWYHSHTTGPESPQYRLVRPYKNYAAMDTQQEDVWETIEKNTEKSKRDELQAAFRSSIENSWTYIFKLDKDISRLSN